ncbi:MAG: thiamine pyrophosphate-binding protein [Fimbriiglobus sp.]
MDWPMSRRGFGVVTSVVTTGATLATSLIPTKSEAAGPLLSRDSNLVSGRLTGAQAIAHALRAEGVGCVYGIPGAQENELWDEFKAVGVPYLLAAHEYGAACMADGYARVTGQPGVLCVVPGPGVTNALTGLGEALLDSSPIVALVGDVATGEKYRPFQVHSLDTVALLKPVCKCVLAVTDVRQIAEAVRRAFRLAAAGEPGPVAVVVPFHLLIEVAEFRTPRSPDVPSPWDQAAFEKALALLADTSSQVGIYAGVGCMNASAALTQVAEVLQAPVATSVSGKGVIDERHPLAVGWGFGAHASAVAEKAFAHVQTLLAIGVKFSEVSTGFYGNPRIANVIHVDIQPSNLGKAYTADVCVPSDAGLFLGQVLTHADRLRRPSSKGLVTRIQAAKADEEKSLCHIAPRPCGIDPLAVIASLRRLLPESAALFMDVSASEHLAAEHIPARQPRTYFNPVDNQAMGWSLPAAIGAARICPSRLVVALMGDGCLLMSMTELATAARESIPVKVLILDDHAYHYMQMLQEAAYRRTTATKLAKLDYRALATGFGLGYCEACTADQLEPALRTAFSTPGPVLVRIATDYGDRKIRWIEAVRKRYAKDLSPAQKARFLARIGGRLLHEGKSD